jgi:type IV secretory pathway VirJ component
VASVTLTAANPSPHVGTATHVTATPVDSKGATVADVTCTFSSSAPAVATVDALGDVLAVAAGTTTITATCGSASASVTITVQLPQLSQLAIDNNTANNIINAIIDIYNQNVAGRSQSSYNGQTVACPNGGTVLIQGLASKASNSNLTTANLTYTMTNCAEVKTDQSFTYSGVVTETGSFDISTNFVSETLQSTGSVAMNGTITITGFAVATVSQNVAFTINRGYNTASGTLGGRQFSY